MANTLEELRQSPYHQQLGRKMCAAFVAQQQGIALSTALNKVPDPVGDSWLIVAEFARQVGLKSLDLACSREWIRQTTGFII